MSKTGNNKTMIQPDPVINDIVIKLVGVSKVYNLYNSKEDRLKEALHPKRKKYHREFFALKDINLEVKKGEILGIVGRNGSGKSTLLKVISKVLTPGMGSVSVDGKIVALLELGAGFNPEFTGIENIYFYCSLLGFRREETDKLLEQILEFAELGDFVYQPVKTYSSGMKARLGFAVSINVDPEILILDEVLAVGDELFRRKCYAKMEEFFKGGKTILFVSHSAGAINELCTRAILLDGGRAILDGPAKLVTMYYQKMLYASGENRKKVLDEIKSLDKDEVKKKNFKVSDKKENSGKNAVSVIEDKSEAEIIKQSHENTADPRDEKPVAYYVEGFKSRSAVRHAACDVDVFDIVIKTNEGRVVNHLVTGDEYTVDFSIRFGEKAENINIGVTFKDEKGKDLAGMSTRNSDKIIPVVNAGDVVKASWSFECVFLSGIYYVDVGIRDVNRTDGAFILKYDDIVNFKIIDTDKRKEFKYGFLDLKIRPCVEHERRVI